MAQYERDLSSLSYTNKDFGTIYPELLELADKISYKWTPSQSDESDPGVVLLKLAALMADKNNYNIDKNILELFPVSVTQDRNAKQIFEQCGYVMRYYRSAETLLRISLTNPPDITTSDKRLLMGSAYTNNSDEEIESAWNSSNVVYYTIPRFTMVADDDNDTIYTITEKVVLKSTGAAQEDIPAMQGIVVEHKINGSTLITTANLDYNNRIYFRDLDVAENGIFIEDTSGDRWTRVDNLLLEAIGTKCYKFGLSLDGYSCYVEFPDDIDSLIGEGLTITYLRTKGRDGNVRNKQLKQFYSTVTSSRYLEPATVQNNIQLTSENVTITNNFLVSNGENPETIDEAYKNYEKIKTTFDTLVSCSDYANYLYSAKHVSNCIVCDRTNDIQSSYKVVENDSETSLTHNTVVEKEVDRKAKVIISDNDGNDTVSEMTIRELVPEMNAFDLRVYALRYVSAFQAPTDYYRSFQVIVPESKVSTTGIYSDSDWASIFNTSSDIKTIQHDYKQFEKNRLLMFKNKYPIEVRIIPRYKLDANNHEESEIRVNVESALMKVLNSRAINFGDAIPYDLVYDTIIESDPRIKAIALDTLQYETYAVYAGAKYVANELSDGTIDGVLPTSDIEIREFKISGDYHEPEMSDIIDTKYLITGSKEYLVYEAIINEMKQLYSDFRNDIYIKSVLAGTTQLLPPDNNFTYSVLQKDSEYLNPVYLMDTNTDITLTRGSNNTETSGELRRYVGSLTENENIMFLSPSLLTVKSYSGYVKYIHNIEGLHGKGTNTGEDYHKNRPTWADRSKGYTVLDPDTDYKLAPDEYIIFFWKTGDGADETTPYTYAKYSGDPDFNGPKVINPSFVMKIQPNPEGIPAIPDDWVKGLKQPSGTISNNAMVREFNTTTGEETDRSMTINSYLDALYSSYFVLSGNQSIAVKQTNRIHLTNNVNGTRKIWWQLNNSSASEHTLFGSSNAVETDSKSQKYILRKNEYLCYTNEQGTAFHILGEGTIIERTWNESVSVASPWSVKAQQLNMDLVSEGPSYLDGSWFYVPINYELYATETEFYQIGTDSQIVLDYVGTSEDVYDDLEKEYKDPALFPIKFDDDHNIVVSGMTVNNGTSVFDNFKIKYIDSEGLETSLPVRIDGENAWQAYSILNVNASPTSPQEIKSHQTITIYSNEKGSRYTTLTELNNSTTYFLTDRTVSYIGGKGINTSISDLSTGVAKAVPLSMYLYVLNGSFDTRVALDSFNAICDLPLYNVIDETQTEKTPNHELTFDCSIPAGGYVIEYTLSNSVKDIQFEYSSEHDDFMSSTILQLFDDNPEVEGKHYLRLFVDKKIVNDSDLPDSNSGNVIFDKYTNEQTVDIKLKVVVDLLEKVVNDAGVSVDATTGTRLTILPLYKHKREDGSEFNNHCALVKQLDKDNKFNYTHVIDSNVLIEDPLRSESFLNDSHIYNKFTICQWDIGNPNIDDNTSIKIVNKVK